MSDKCDWGVTGHVDSMGIASVGGASASCVYRITSAMLGYTGGEEERGIVSLLLRDLHPLGNRGSLQTNKNLPF